MPGYLISPIAQAANIPILPSGNITANNLQSAIYQLDSIKPQSASVSASVSSVSASVTTLNNNLSASVSALNTNISSVEGVALIGL